MDDGGSEVPGADQFPYRPACPCRIGTSAPVPWLAILLAALILLRLRRRPQ
jgi:hypothetical protein